MGVGSGLSAFKYPFLMDLHIQTLVYYPNHTGLFFESQNMIIKLLGSRNRAYVTSGAENSGT